MCLDRRGLTCFPEITSEPKLRLMSLQHNLISRLEADNFAQLTRLVFLDLYDNQIEKICDLCTLENLRVLLVGKNRMRKIEGLKPLGKLEVLDLHGNQIVQISGLEMLESLKVLNLAGNNVKTVGFNDFHGLISLRELNLKRNRIKKLLGFGETPQLQKLYLSNNDIQKIEDMGSLAKALQIREVTIDGNPVTLNADCVSFLVSYLPNLQVLSTMQVNEQVRRAAMAWRTSKEQSNSAFLDLSAEVCVNVRREEVITNAKTNWELLRSQAKSFGAGTSKVATTMKSERLRGLQLQMSSNKIETTKLKGLAESKSNNNKRAFGSLTSINENDEARKIEFKNKRSNSSDALYRLENANRANALSFKLPPILVPIINNLTNSRINNENWLDPRGNNGTMSHDSNETTTTTDSDLESSESHESLKSGLRNHLKKNNRALSIVDTGDNDYYDLCTAPAFPSSLSLFKKLENDERNAIVRNSKSSLASTNAYNKTSPHLQSFISDANRGFPIGMPVNEIARNANQVKTDLYHRASLSNNNNNSSVDSNRFGDSSSSSTTKPDDLDDSEDDKSRVKSAQIKKMVHYKSNRAATARAKHRAVAAPAPPSPQPIPPKEKEQGGDYLVEIVGRCLNVYGQGALRFIDRPWNPAKATDVNIVKFNYVQFQGIAIVLAKLKTRFPNAEHFIFKETNISHLGQINALAEVQGLTSVQIEPEGNPIVSKDWKTYAIFRLAHWGLKVINGREIADRDIELANEEYSGLADIVMWSLPESLLQPLLQRLHLEKAQKSNGEQITAKQFLFNSDPALRNVVAKEALQLRRGNVTQEDLISRHKGKVHLSSMIDRTIDAVRKLQILENEWPTILCEIIRDTLVDYSQMNSYMKRCSASLQLDK